MNFKPNIPIVHEIDFAADKIIEALLLFDEEHYVTILDSGKTDGKGAKLLIAGFDPFLLIESKNSRYSINNIRQGSIEYFTGDVLKILDEKLSELFLGNSNGFPQRFAGGCVATLSYDLGFQFEESIYPCYSKRKHDEPDAYFAIYDTFIVHDYSKGKSFIVSCNSHERIEQIEEQLNEKFQSISADSKNVIYESDSFFTSTVVDKGIKSNLTRVEYEKAVDIIKEYIASGDIYQANLTQQMTYELPKNITTEKIFKRLRHIHPAPFSAYIQRQNDTVISASPERFLYVRDVGEGKIVEAYPIKGTRPRGNNSVEDKQLREELLRSEKDRAENIMIVDLLRNDIGKVCEYGSVIVEELCALHEHPSLFHLVSKVRGKLRENVKVSDLLRATFPCGSITGAPKIRAMEIIDEIETTPRGLSMGAIGYFSFSGSLDLNVAIRTMVIRDNIARFNVGGGIVADSVPTNEYDESLVKATALRKALNAKISVG